MHVTIRADGGSSIGYGHLVRTGALATSWPDRTGTVEYVTKTPEATRKTVPAEARVTPVEDRSAFLSWIENTSIDVLVIDSYETNHTLHRHLSAAVPYLCIISDQNRHPVHCDVLVNGNLHAPGLSYDWTGSAPRWCLGPDYALLRERIRALGTDHPPWRDSPERALVTMGGSDDANLTPMAIRSFDGLDLSVDAVVGPGFSKAQEREIRETADCVTANVTVVRDPPDLPERMFHADFAWTTASSTIYELLALGTPITCVPVADNQEPIAAALQERDLAVVVTSEDEQRFRSAVESYIDDNTIRRTRRERGRNLIDGHGAERTVEVIQELIN